MNEAKGCRPMAVVGSLDQLTGLLASRNGLYVRWSRGPDCDLPEPFSRDALTGAELPGLSANPMDVEDWWKGRSLRTWAARRLYDYSHLARAADRTARPWLLAGTEAGRGPDNEPLVRDVQPLGWIDPTVLAEAETEIEHQPGWWGPLDRL
ncbi:DUF6098 family protein [Streptomyces sp. NPDC059650]|uniref:DUF6098 family protein n=1 Tax=Streptomyces sp. NPDC059650 TaxID=3346896 RepID=UPI00368B95E9